MDDAHAPIFADAASLEAYCSRIRSRLEQRTREQSGLLDAQLESLRSLLRTAHALGDRDLEAELSSHVARIEARRSDLAHLATEGNTPSATPPASPPPAPSFAAASRAQTPLPEVPPPTAPDAAPAHVPQTSLPAEQIALEVENPTPSVPSTPPVASLPETGPEPLPAASVNVPAPPPATPWSGPAPAPASPWAPLPPAAMAPPPAWQSSPGAAAVSAPPPAAPNPEMPWLPVIADPAPAKSLEDEAWAQLAAQAAGFQALPPSTPPTIAWPSAPETAPPPAAAPAVAAAAPDWDTNFAVPASATDPEPDALCLQVSVGDREWVWRMLSDSAVIGRATPGTSLMPDLDLWPDQTVSRRHLEVARREGRFFVTDQASANGSLLNDAPLPPNVETEIQPGDQLRLGAASYLKVVTP